MARPSRSIAARLTALLAGGLVVFWLLAMATAGLVVNREMHEVFDSVLQEAAQQLLPDILLHHGAELAALPPGARPIVPPAVPHEEYITYQLFDMAGRVLLRSHGAADTAGPVPPAAGFTHAEDGYAYVEASVDRQYLLRLVEPPNHRSHAINDTLWNLFLPLLGLVLAALLMIPWTVRRSMLPLTRLRDEIGRRGGEDLSTIDDPGLPQELAPIGQDVNLLLLRLRRAMEAERSFTANAAHELRTPVASALAQAQLLAAHHDADAAGRQQARLASGLVEELRRLALRLEKLLQLARAEAGVMLRMERVDLLVPLQLIVDEFAAHPGLAGRLHFDDGGVEAIPVAADLDALAIAFRNLIENAVRHGAPEGLIEVRATADRRVTIVNAGPVIPAEQLERLRERFVSHGGTGSGLGLSIVQAIVTQCGGSFVLLSPATGRAEGFEATVTFPTCTPDQQNGSRP